MEILLGLVGVVILAALWGKLASGVEDAAENAWIKQIAEQPCRACHRVIGEQISRPAIAAQDAANLAAGERPPHFYDLTCECGRQSRFYVGTRKLYLLKKETDKD